MMIMHIRMNELHELKCSTYLRLVFAPTLNKIKLVSYLPRAFLVIDAVHLM